jgi:hypothetical protein
MTSSFPYRLIVMTATILALGACRSPGPTPPPQHYVPITERLQPFGELYLSNRQLRLTGLEGTMELQYAGRMPESAGEDLAGASVFRVKNDRAHFEKNSGKDGYCAQAPRWVAVNSESGAPAWSRKIWVGLLTLERWAEFTPATDRACLSGEYVRSDE